MIQKKIVPYALSLIFVALLLCAASCTPKAAPLEVKKIHIKDKVVYVEIANTAEERTKGLQGRKTLLENWGMLFVYSEEQELAFWMKDTLIPLDIVFIDKDGTISEINHGMPNDETVIRSNDKAQYALEMNQNWFKDNGMQVGDKVDIPLHN
jgi:uncharacterized protein